VLGAEPEIVAKYVATGQVKIVFWPVLNHGDPSVYSTMAAECVGQQSSDAFWAMHELLFVNQRDLWSAGRDYYVNAAVSVGADQTTFAACYDSPAALATVMSLDTLRTQRGVLNQPTFDINGQLFFGSQPFSAFDQAIQAALP
jgi:protein-disulfide isomerase